MGFIKRYYYVEEPIPAFLFLMKQLGVSQGQSQRIITTGRLFVNGKVWERSGHKIQGHVEVKMFVPQSKGVEPIFTTPDFGLFDKPSGVLVHPRTRFTNYSLLDDIRHVYGKDANAIHRIDKETSGLLLVSRNKESERRLKLMFESRNVKKSYLAWVRGKIDKPFKVNVPLKRNDDFSTIKLKVLVDPDGKDALTYFEPIEYDEIHDATLIQAFPHTGRQHQIRVHLFHVKHPIIGDPIYGVPTEIAIKYLDKEITEEERLYYMGAKRLLLHAQTLTFDYQGVSYNFNSKFDFESLKSLIVKPKNRFSFCLP
ncbi:RluA family pseudouridine synthase [Hydrogenimonas thermophila]|uniref:RNA pseudouridylate synthase n=1 Tax=Hydrogenimonas thermophila TaxID=223786 RepID=A0A1I5LJ96_9BACT|nr:RluA family pseudouridine synthase [Hydrogenimonas thermophila]SFO97265.1 23S rRNA pseudouridine1911/1915/1917 synthase [Hydrogenimonas thermophila]